MMNKNNSCKIILQTRDGLLSRESIAINIENFGKDIYMPLLDIDWSKMETATIRRYSFLGRYYKNKTPIYEEQQEE